MTAFKDIPDVACDIAGIYLDGLSKNMEYKDISKMQGPFSDDMAKYFAIALGELEMSVPDSVAVVRAIVNGTGEDMVLIVYGAVDIGDRILLTRMYSMDDRTFGIVAYESKRKGVFVYKKRHPNIFTANTDFFYSFPRICRILEVYE